MSWAIGFNAALKSGWDTWNKLSDARKIAVRDAADTTVKANNAAADSDVKAYGQAATDAMSTNSLDAAYKTFGGDDYKNLTDSQKQTIADELTTRGLYNPKTGVYNARGVAEMYQPKAQQSALPVNTGSPVDTVSAQPVTAGTVGTVGTVGTPAGTVGTVGTPAGTGVTGTTPAQTAIPQWQSDIANNARLYGEEAANRNRLIQQDLGESVQRRMKTLGDDNAQAMHTYNSWYNPDALDKEDEYKLNQGFKLLGRAVSSGDPGAQSLLVAGYNAMNPGAKILSNGDGTYSMADANGNPTGKPFVPSVAQMGQTMTQLYNVARAIKTADFDKLSESMLKSAQTRYATANADIAEANVPYATENAKNKAEGLWLANEGQKNANIISGSNAKFQDEKNALAIKQTDTAIKKAIWEMQNGDTLTKLKAQEIYQQLVIKRAELAAYQQRIALMGRGNDPGITFADPDENGMQTMKNSTGKVIGFSASNGVYFPPNDKDGRITAELTRQGNALGLGVVYVPGDGGFAVVKDGYVVKGANGADLRGLTAGGVSSALKQIGVKAGGKGAKASKGPSKAPQRAIDLPEYGY